MSWKEYQLGDLISVKHGYAFKSKFFAAQGEQIVLTPGNFHEKGGFKLRGDRDRYYVGQYPLEFLLRKGDIIIAMTEQGEGLLGSSALIPEDRKYLHNQRLGLVCIKDKCLVDSFYIYKAFNTEDFRRQISASASGVKVRHTAPERIYRCNILLPPFLIQQKIAAILSAYDDLIENNLKRIKLLEELAQITYEEWFVRLRFPGHKSTPFNNETNKPEGWKTKSIGELIAHEIGGGWGLDEMDSDHTEPAFVIRGTDIGSLNTSNTQNVPFRFHKKSNLRSRKLTHGDIVFEVSGGSRTEGVAKTAFITTRLLEQFGQDVMCASFCKLVHPTDASVGLFLFHYFKFLREIKSTEIFEIRGASSIINYNWAAFLKFQKVVMPPENIIKDFYSNTIVIHDEIQNLAKQNQGLREARDILLPRLMTGMIDVEQYNPARLMQEDV